ncbi:hypothetical protein IID10_20685 [candidate division KSB1 bacterium]|nr:hypothetical protein [candidate division KSB1 bacterium]
MRSEKQSTLAKIKTNGKDKKNTGYQKPGCFAKKEKAFGLAASPSSDFNLRYDAAVCVA